MQADETRESRGIFRNPVWRAYIGDDLLHAGLDEVVTLGQSLEEGAGRGDIEARLPEMIKIRLAYQRTSAFSWDRIPSRMASGDPLKLLLNLRRARPNELIRFQVRIRYMKTDGVMKIVEEREEFFWLSLSSSLSG